MKPIEIRELARATCTWLAYKHITGFDSSIGEAMLAIPISEYLKTKTHWNLQSELLYNKLELPPIPELSCDFAGTRIHSEAPGFILETKYLKNAAYNRSRDIAADLIRLSLPLDVRLKRYFLLAGTSKCFEAGRDRFLAECKLFDMQQGKGKYFRPKQEVSEAAFRAKFPKYETLLSASHDHLLDYAFIQCGASEEIRVEDTETFRVMIWSVGRSERLEEDGLSDT